MKNRWISTIVFALVGCAVSRPAPTASGTTPSLTADSVSKEALAKGEDECDVFEQRIAGGMTRPGYEVADELQTFGPSQVIWVHRPDPLLIELARRCVDRGYK